MMSKDERRMRMQRKSEMIFNKIAEAIDQINGKKKKENSSEKNKKYEERKSKRTCFYELYLFKTRYDIKKIEKEKIPSNINLEKNKIFLIQENKGYFKGSEIALMELLKSLYEK
jgi:hypothetical protein